MELAASYTSRIRVDPAWLLQRVSFSAFCIASAKFCSNKADYTQFFPPVGKEVASPSHPFQLAALLAEKHGKSPRYLYISFLAFCIASVKFHNNKADYMQSFPLVGKRSSLA